MSCCKPAVLRLGTWRESLFAFFKGKKQIVTKKQMKNLRFTMKNEETNGLHHETHGKQHGIYPSKIRTMLGFKEQK